MIIKFVLLLAISVTILGSISFADAQSAPDAPNLKVKVIDESSVTLTWNKPSGNGSSITGYEIVYRKGGDNYTRVDINNANTLSYTADNLVTGYLYIFSVQAINANGGTFSDSEHAIPLQQVPSEPRTLKVKAYVDGQVLLTWLLPEHSRASKITGYTIKADPAGSGSEIIKNIGVPSVFGHTGKVGEKGAGEKIYYHIIKDLPTGTSYGFELSAKNSAGTGDSVSTTANLSNIKHSNSPKNLVALAGNGKVLLTWDRASSGGDFIVYYSLNGQLDSWKNLPAKSATSFILDKNGAKLVNGNQYKFVVESKGKYSNVAFATPKNNTPGTPTSLEAKSYSNSVKLTWNAPTGGNNSQITDYQIQYKRSSDSSWKDAESSDGAGISKSTSTTINYLSNGVKYDFRVKAVIVDGGNWSSTISAIPSPPPKNLQAKPNDGFVTLIWDAPNAPGITGYKVESRTDGSYETKHNNIQSPATVSDLTNGIAHEFKVTVLFSSDDGAYATISATPNPTVPSPPTNLQIVAYDNKFKFSWNAPHDGGSPITSYKLEYRIEEPYTDPQTREMFEVHFWKSTTSTSTSRTIINTDGFQAARVYAINQHGTSEPSEIVTTIIPRKAPGPVCSVTAEPLDRDKIKLTWTTPDLSPLEPGTPLIKNGITQCRAYTDSTPTTDYEINYHDWYGSTTPNSPWNKVSDGKSTEKMYTHTFSNTPVGTFLIYSVSAMNAQGMKGTLSPASDIIVLGKPNPPTNLQAVPGVGTVKLTWDRPSNYTSDNIIRYDIEYKSSDSDDWITHQENHRFKSITIPLDSGLYDIRVIAYPRATDPPFRTYTASDIISASPDAAAPDKPTIRLGNTDNNFVNLSWNEPDDNGSPIFNYAVEYKKHEDEWRIAQITIPGSGTTPATTTTKLILDTSIRIQINNLDSTPHNFRVFAINSEGYSESSNVITHPTPQESEITPIPETEQESPIPVTENENPKEHGIPIEQESPVPEQETPTEQVPETKQETPVEQESQQSETEHEIQMLSNGLVAVPGDGYVKLAWEVPDDSSHFIISYGSDQIDVGQVTEYTITNLTNDTLYEFSVSEIGKSQSYAISAIPSDAFGDTIIGLINPDIQTATLAVERFNESHDTKLGLTIYAGDTLTGIKTLHELDINYMIGPVTTDSLDYIDQNNIVFINDRTTTPDISKPDNTFSLVPNDTNLGIIFSQIFKNDEIENVLTIHRDDSWGDSIFESLSNSIDETITLHPPIKYTDNYENVTTQLEEYDLSDSVILLLGFEETAEIITLTDQIDVQRYSSFDTNIESVITPIVTVPENIINESLESFAIYDGVTLLGHAIEAGDDIIESIPNIAINLAAASDNLTLNEYGDLAFVTYDITTLQDGELVILDTITVSNIKLNTIDVIVFNDTNNNGIKDNDEQGVQTNVYLLTPPSIIEGSTNLFGKYSFVNPPEADMVFIIIDNMPHFKNIEGTVYFPLTS